jgi:hypothetical protein
MLNVVFLKKTKKEKKLKMEKENNFFINEHVLNF